MQLAQGSHSGSSYEDLSKLDTHSFLHNLPSNPVAIYSMLVTILKSTATCTVSADGVVDAGRCAVNEFLRLEPPLVSRVDQFWLAPSFDTQLDLTQLHTSFFLQSTLNLLWDRPTV